MKFVINGIGKGTYGTDTTPLTKNNLFRMDTIVHTIDDIIAIPNRSYHDLQDLPTVIQTVNGNAPDEDGNVVVTADTVEWGSVTGQLEYQTDLKSALDEKALDSETVKSVNGVTPDEDGNVTVSGSGTVTSVNGIAPDENGNVNISTSTEGVDQTYVDNADSATLTSANEYTDTAVGGKLDKQDNIQGLWRGTQADYNAIATKDANTLYIIQG